MAVDGQIVDESEFMMNIKICKNIYKLRKENDMTQAQVAEYLGVSPQAVSKWEQEAAIPDVYLIPKIAFLFNVSIDALFGTTNLENVEMLVMKYSTMRNERNYREAKEAIETLIDMNDEDIEAYRFMCHLEYQRSIESITIAKEASKKLAELAHGKNDDYVKRARLQQMRLDKMMGDVNFVDEAYEAFKQEETEVNFNYLILALFEVNRDKEILDLAEKYIDTFTAEEQGRIYPNLMEVALRTRDFSFGEKCFGYITKYNSEKEQVFNAWWLLWKLCKSEGLKEREGQCRVELLKQLPSQNYNEFNMTRIKEYLEVTDGDFTQIM